MAWIVTGGLAVLSGCGVGASSHEPGDPGPGVARVTGITIVEDDNGDGTLSPGEGGRLRVTLANDGGEALQDLALRLTLVSARVTLSGGPTIDCGRLDPGEQAVCGGSWVWHSVHAAATAEPGASIPISVQITAREGAWSQESAFTIAANGAAPKVTGVAVKDDSNADGVLNPGESARLALTVANQGTSRLLGLQLEVSSASEGVGLTPSTLVECGDIEPGDAVVCGSSWSWPRITVAEAALSGPAAFSVVARDDTGAAWQLSFAVPVSPTAALPAVDEVLVVNDTDGDGALSPGETAKLRAALRNTGTSALRGVTVAFSSQTQGIAVKQGEVVCGDLDPGETVICGSSWSWPGVTAAKSAAVGEPLSLTIDVADEQGATWTLHAQVPVVATGAVPVLGSVTVTGDDSGDGQLQAGESARLRVIIANEGTSRLFEAEVSIASSDPRVTVDAHTMALCGDVDPGAEQTCGSSWSWTAVEAAEGAAAGPVPLTVFVIDGLGNEWELEELVPLD